MQFPRFLRPLFGKVTWQVKTSSKLIYLTFDDGPVPEVTPQVLDILDEYGWKATFFCVGENVQKHPEVYQEVLKRGHRVGNHSFNHIRGYKHTVQDYVANVKKAAAYIDSRLFRPPHGQLTRRLKRKLTADYTVVMWDVLTYDYDASMTEEAVLKIVKRGLRPGSIVVFHDSIKAKDNVLTALPQALAFWKEKGYSFGLL